MPSLFSKWHLQTHKSVTLILPCFRRKVQEQLWQAQSENAALKDTVRRARAQAAASTNMVLPHSVHCADSQDRSTSLQMMPHHSCSAHTEVVKDQGSLSADYAPADSRVLFHWSGMDFSQVSCQRDKAVHDATAMSFELEQARCKLRCVHTQLRSMMDMEDEMTKVSLNVIYLAHCVGPV